MSRRRVTFSGLFEFSGRLRIHGFADSWSEAFEPLCDAQSVYRQDSALSDIEVPYDTTYHSQVLIAHNRETQVTLTLTNTLSGKRESFVPAGPDTFLYNCTARRSSKRIG